MKELAAIGDVDSAHGQYYAERVSETAETSRVKQKVLREWFDRCLITDSGIRTEVMWKAGDTDGLNDDAIDQLYAAHLIRREERRDATWLELSHTLWSRQFGNPRASLRTARHWPRRARSSGVIFCSGGL